MMQTRAGSMPEVSPELAALLEAVRRRVEAAGVFAGAEIRPDGLWCAAKEAAAPAQFGLTPDADGVWVCLVTADRWLSQSIEADLVHTGDKLEDLIDEELVDLGCSQGPLPVEHFRSEAKLFTFRSRLPLAMNRLGDAAVVELAAACLLAYEAAFRELGDMQGGDEE